MTVEQFISATKEAVTGSHAGGLLGEASTVKEVVTGNGYGYSGPAGLPMAIKENVTGFQTGTLVASRSQVKEVVSGNRPGQDIPPVFIHQVKEVIGRDSSYKFIDVTKEVLIYAPNELTSVPWSAHGVVEQLAQFHARTPAPLVWSLNTVAAYRQLVGRSNKLPAPHSVEEVRALRAQVAMKAAPLGPANVLSTMRVSTLRQVIAKSRYIPYNPISGNFVLSYRAKVAQARTGFIAPSQARSADMVVQQRQLVALSKRAGYQIRVPQLFELVARTRIVTFSAPTSASGIVEQVAQARTVTAKPHSQVEARTDVQQVAQHRSTPGILRSTIVTITYSGMVAQRRDVGIPHSLTCVTQDVQQVAQHRDPIHYWSSVHVPVERQLVAQHRVPGPLPYTGEYAKSVRALVAQHKGVPMPNQISDWRIVSQRQLIAQLIVTPGIVRSFTEVRSEFVQYALGADYPPPNQVMGPETGAFVLQQYALAAQHRHVDSPQTQVKESIFMFEVGQVPVVGDAFPPKGTSYTTADTFMVVEQVAVGDMMPQPTAAYSDTTAFSVTSPVVVSDDTWADPSAPISDAITVALHEAVAVGDTMPDPLAPLSDAQAFTVGQFAAVGDASLPDPRQPTSEVETRLVGALPLVGEAFANPMEPTSSVDMFALCGFAVIRDTSMLRIPPRSNRARPVVTVSMS